MFWLKIESAIQTIIPTKNVLISGCEAIFAFCEYELYKLAAHKIFIVTTMIFHIYSYVAWVSARSIRFCTVIIAAINFYFASN